MDFFPCMFKRDTLSLCGCIILIRHSFVEDDAIEGLVRCFTAQHRNRNSEKPSFTEHVLAELATRRPWSSTMLISGREN